MGCNLQVCTAKEKEKHPLSGQSTATQESAIYFCLHQKKRYILSSCVMFAMLPVTRQVKSRHEIKKKLFPCQIQKFSKMSIFLYSSWSVKDQDIAHIELV